MDHLSYSSVEKALACPRNWFYKYVLKQDLPAGDAASFGKAFDAAVADALGLAPGDAKTPAEKVEGVDEAVSLYLASDVGWKRARWPAARNA